MHKQDKEIILSEYMIQAKYHDPKSAGRATKELLELNDKPTCIF